MEAPMTPDVSAFVKLCTFNTGRRSSCLRVVHRQLEQAGIEDLRALAAEAIAHEERAYELEARWRSRPRGVHAPEAKLANAELCRTLAGLGHTLRVTARAYGAEDPRAQQAERLHGELFPRGVAYVTRLGYVEQWSRVDTLLARAEDPALQEAARELGVQPLLARVAEVNARLHASLHAIKIQPFAEVAAARKAGQENLSRLAVRLLTRWIDGSADGAEAEAAGFAFRTIRRYDAAIRRYRKRRAQRRRGRKAEAQTLPQPASPHEPGSTREERSA